MLALEFQTLEVLNHEFSLNLQIRKNSLTQGPPIMMRSQALGPGYCFNQGPSRKFSWGRHQDCNQLLYRPREIPGLDRTGGLFGWRRASQ